MAYESYTASQAGGINNLLQQRQQGVDESQQALNRFTTNQPSGGFTADGSGSFLNASAALGTDLYNQTNENTRLKGLAQSDPWGFYRASAADNLSGFAGQEDPSNIYRTKLANMVGGKFAPDDPSYQWRFDQGQQAVERSQAAKGLLNSGNAALELQKYGQGAASQEYGAQFQRLLQGMSGVSQQFDTQFNRLAQMAGINLDPLGADKVNSANASTAASLTSSLTNTGESAREWNGQMDMAQQYEQGVKAGLMTDYSMYGGK